MSSSRTPTSRRRVTWLVVAVVIALGLVARVLVILFAEDRLIRDELGANVLDIVVISLGITALIVTTVLRGAYAAARNAVRTADYPDALPPCSSTGLSSPSGPLNGRRCCTTMRRAASIAWLCR